MIESDKESMKLQTLVFRLKTGCKQYEFKDLGTLENFCNSKPYRDEFLRIMHFDKSGYRLTDEWIQAKEAIAWTREIFKTTNEQLE